MACVTKPFLEAHWSHLCIISYPVPESLLRPYLPAGLELDTYLGHPHVSVVAFDFEDTRVKGIAWPCLTDFPEINLRFYVRHGAERGVVFIKELVPSRIIAWVANKVYNEPYMRCRMESNVHRTGNGLEVDHTLWHKGKKNTIKVAATRDPPLPVSEDTAEHWFKEHEFGFGRDRSGLTLRYHVVHPRWQVYKVEWAEVKLDWAELYGPQWKAIGKAKPTSMVLAEGSKVAVFPAGRCSMCKRQ